MNIYERYSIPRYDHTTVEDFYANNLNKFDALVISEVLERIPLRKKNKFLQKCISCVKVTWWILIHGDILQNIHSHKCVVMQTDGNIFITARNRTISSFRMLLSFATSNRLEFGHHSWSNGISPHLLEKFLTSCKFIKIMIDNCPSQRYNCILFHFGRWVYHKKCQRI